jgi:dGTPase
VTIQRSIAWAETMQGHRAGERPGGASGFRRAHADSQADVTPGGGVTRERREEVEDLLLVAGATRSRGAGEREVAEAPDPYRTCFERDRDRIVHGTAFRRLAGKTQVFVFPEDHQRTRLTHALEVAQVATAIARATGLNVALTEAIALGHDCGHGPGGHASEDAFSPYIDEGYDHAVWGADVVLRPLNLCAETLDGIRNHSWSRPAPSTPEGEVVSWADRIAYVCHDFEDACHVGIVDPEALPPSVRSRCGERRSRQLDSFIAGVVQTTLETGAIGMADPLAEALGAFRRFNYDHIYMRPDSVQQSSSVIRVLRALVEHYAEHPDQLPDREPGASDESDESAHVVDAGTDRAVRRSVTYVAGMTDRFAFERARTVLGWATTQLPLGIS